MNHNYENENDVHESEIYTDDVQESRGFWAGLLTGLLVGGLAGTLSGGLVGAATMLLLAPRSGKKTRARLLRQGRAVRDQTAETAEDAMDQAGDKAHQVSHDLRRQAKKLERRGQAMLDGKSGR